MYETGIAVREQLRRLVERAARRRIAFRKSRMRDTMRPRERLIEHGYDELVDATVLVGMVPKLDKWRLL